MFLLGLTNSIKAQTVEINNTVGAYSGNAVVGQLNYHAQRTSTIDAEIGATNFIGAPNAISKIAYSVNALTAITFPLTVDSMYIYMKNVATTSKTFTARCIFINWLYIGLLHSLILTLLVGMKLH
jgi:hypothetical protein